MIGFSEKWVRMRCVEGFFEASKVGKQWRIAESSVQNILENDLRESKNIQLSNFAQTLKNQKRKEAPKGEEKESLVMNGKKSRLPDRLSLGNRGYYLRKYPKSQFYPNGLEKWIIWWEEDGKRKTETINHADNANEAMEYLEFKRRKMFDKGFCCPTCGYNLNTGEQEDLSGSEVTFNQLFKEYLNTRKKKRSFRILENRVKILSGYLKDVNKPVDLSMNRVDELVRQMEEENYRGSTKNTYLKMLSAVLNFAKDRKYIKEVIPVCKAKVDEDDSEEKRFVPADKFWAIYDTIESQYLKDMLIIGRTCGNRPIELETLKWDCVEFNGDSSKFHVKKEHDKAKKGKNCFIMNEVKPIFLRLKSENGSEYVFNNSNNQPIQKGKRCGDLRQIQIETGIEKPYDYYEMCRHSGITDKGHEPGISLGKLMAFAGHSNSAMTDRYLHSMEGKNQAITPEEITKRVGR